MCGIAGIIGKNLQHQKGEVKARAMIQAIRHRGPDGEGFFVSDEAMLGMCRLSIIDLKSPGLCPVFYRNLKNQIVEQVLIFNGEIYNYLELKKELKLLGHDFITTSDSEVLLYAYREWGEKCLDRLNGMFAFAIWDVQKKQLFCARDRAGEKPFYYYFDGEQFIFASELKALLKIVPHKTFQLPESYLALEYPTGADTFFKEIKALPPAQALTVQNNKLKIWEYWQIDSSAKQISDSKKALEKLDFLLCDAIKLRLRADVPSGVYLSGGIDSGLIAAIAKPKVCFSVNFPYGEKYDELKYACVIAKKIKVDEHIVVRPTEIDFKKYFREIVYFLDLPVGSFSAFALFMLAKKAKEKVKIVLGGEGVDELFSGYTRYLFLHHDEAIYQNPFLKNYRSLGEHYHSTTLKRFAHLTNRGSLPDEQLAEIIAPHFKKFSSVEHAMGYTEFKTLLVTLLQMEDRMSAAASIENRTPFLDHRIIEFAFSLAPELKIRNGQPKWLIFELAKKYLPREVVERKEKKGLVVPMNLWLKNLGKERGEFDRSKYNQIFLNKWKQVFLKEQKSLNILL